MTALALEALGIAADAEIHIEKRLPVQGGLGAGSANAVAALVGLQAELGIATSSGKVSLGDAGPSTPLRFAQDDRSREFAEDDKSKQTAQMSSASHWGALRLEIAARVGSDVPLFLIGGAVLGLDRGQQVYPLPDFEPMWCVVATPEVGVSTAQAFRDWDALCATEGLTAEASTDKLNKLSRAYASAFAGANDFSASIAEDGQGAGSSGVLSSGEDLAGPNESALVRTGITSWIQNDFEQVVFAQHPSLAEIKRLLAATGTPEAALHASLSGSGSALYGLYRTRGDAQAACQRLGSAGVRSLLTRTLQRSKYWREMLMQEQD
jgi:4-diphosphocytidyl-2-C-methyl-D-erythritol kinase